MVFNEQKIEFVVLTGDEGQATASFSHWLTGLQSHPPTSCHHTSYVIGQSTKGMMTQGLYNNYDKWLTVFTIKYVLTQNWFKYLLLSQYALFSSISILKFVDTCCITFSLSILGKNSIKIQDYVQCKWRESIRCWRSWQFYNFIMLEQIHV